MRIIDADALMEEVNTEIREYMLTEKGMRSLIRNAPTIDAVEVVRCQDCKHWVYNFNGCARNPCTEPWYATDFCNYGEREGE